jgi:hypothetical protein
VIATPHKFAGIPQLGETEPEDEVAAARRVLEAAQMIRGRRTEAAMRRYDKTPAPYTIPTVGPAWTGDDEASI